MAIVKIEEVYLYVSEVVPNAAENIQAVAFMENCGVPFVRMMYNDASQHAEAFAALNSWWTNNPLNSLPPLDTFPFVTYVEVHDDLPARLSPVKYLKGIDAIKTIVDLYNSASK